MMSGSVFEQVSGFTIDYSRLLCFSLPGTAPDRAENSIVHGGLLIQGPYFLPR